VGNFPPQQRGGDSPPRVGNVPPPQRGGDRGPSARPVNPPRENAAPPAIGRGPGVNRPDEGNRFIRPGAPRTAARPDFNARRDDGFDRGRGPDRRFLGGNSVRIGNRSFDLARSNYQPAQFGHRWYSGHWNGNWNWGRGGFVGTGGPYWGYGWGLNGGWGLGGGYYGWRPLGWGLGAWGLGSLIYGSGYWPYWNPYYGAGAIGVYDYAQPIQVAYASVDDSIAVRSDDMLNSAIDAFRRGNYDAALDIVDRAIGQFPKDAVLHEFRALVLFARRDYVQSAATIHSVLAVGPGWDWSTLRSLYVDVGMYTAQLRALEDFVNENENDAAARFLLAYHYMSDGYPDAAAKQLRQVVRLVPNDRVAADILKMIETPASETSTATVEPPTPRPPAETATRPPTETAARTIDESRLRGTWRAERNDGSHFELTLADNSFTWKFTPKGGTPQEFTGNYSVEGNVLILNRTDGGTLAGEVQLAGAGGFNFRLLGAPSEDRGLDFGK
jgi:tetratricopeptide (TPR) repeat protein